MIINPDIEEWFSKLQGKPHGGGSVRGGAGVPSYVEQALQGIVKPGQGMFGFKAPDIAAKYRALPGEPAHQLPSPMGGTPSPLSGGSGGTPNLGGAAKAAGLEKLGQGAAQLMKGIGDTQKRLADARQYTPMSKLMAGNPGATMPGAPGPLSQQMARNPGATMPTIPPAAPYSPAPVGEASSLPLAAQGNGPVQPIPPIGGGGGGLPTFAQGMPGASATASAGGGGAASFQPHHGAQNIVTTQQYYNALIQRGMSPAAAAAYAGNAQFESGAKPGQVILDPATDASSHNWGTGSAAVGSLQWEGDRKAGVAPTLDSQADKIVSELKAGNQGLTWNQVNAMTDPAAAAAAVNYKFERPQYPGQSNAQRQNYASQVFNQYGRGGGHPAPGPSISAPSAQAYAAAPPSTSGPAAPAFAGPGAPSSPSEPRQISPGQPQTGPAYSDETWNNRPKFDYSGPGGSPAPSTDRPATNDQPIHPMGYNPIGDNPATTDKPGPLSWQGIADRATPIGGPGGSPPLPSQHVTSPGAAGSPTTPTPKVDDPFANYGSITPSDNGPSGATPHILSQIPDKPPSTPGMGYMPIPTSGTPMNGQFAPISNTAPPVPQTPDQSLGQLQTPGDPGANQLASSLANGPMSTPQLDQSAMLAMALSQPSPDMFAATDVAAPMDFGGGGFLGGLFG